MLGLSGSDEICEGFRMISDVGFLKKGHVAYWYEKIDGLSSQ